MKGFIEVTVRGRNGMQDTQLTLNVNHIMHVEKNTVVTDVVRPTTGGESGQVCYNTRHSYEELRVLLDKAMRG